MNNVILLGRLVKEAEIKYTANGRVVAQFTLAVDRPYTSADGKKEADFIPCVLWGKSAETLGNYVSKGQRVLVEGRLQIRSYDAKDGSKRWIAEVICDRFEFIERKESGGNTYQPQQNAQPQQSSSFESMGSAVYDVNLPF